MHLTKIKLAGFKSFVDPTTVLLPSNLVAVVGPNGCGKSNIIDAVCWVMGESSAKFLRGESLTDVIFNGSSARKPIGMASIELVFDNSDGSIGGQYASYAEISIRRQINRESEASYFLNGTRCRRRDIIDIFLGTGLGPRSYSIIGQNMIQRIVEARPDDMRTYLEEAAGVSKFKERRRETENRIQHTQDNLARLNDVRAELDKQLTTLRRQSSAAEKFKILKDEERQLKAQWLTVQWRNFDTHLVSETLQIQQHATGLESRQANLSDFNLQLEYKRDAQRLAQDQLQEVQRHYYAIGNEVTRLEQDIQHHQSRQRQWQEDYAQAEKDWLEAKNQIEENELNLVSLSEEIQQGVPRFAEAKEAAQQSIQALSQGEEAMHDWQEAWEQFNKRSAQQTQTASVEQTRIQHLEQKISARRQQQAKLAEEQSQMDFSKLETELEEFSQRAAECTAQVEGEQYQLTETQQAVSQLQTEERATTKQLDQLRSQMSIMQGKQASLEALQETALGQRDQTMTQWLKKNKLDQKLRLGQTIEVEAGWEKAVETVLGVYLQAICVDERMEVFPLVDQCGAGHLYAVTQGDGLPTVQVQDNQLISKVRSSWALNPFLADIYIADNTAAALDMLDSLAPHESVITPEGAWMGAAWLAVSRNINPEAGVLQREHELKQLRSKIKALIAEKQVGEEKLLEIRNQLKTLEEKRSQLQKSVNSAQGKAAEWNMQKKMHITQLTVLEKRAEQLTKEQDEAAREIEIAQQELTQSRSSWQQAMLALENEAGLKDQLTSERDQLREQLQAARLKANQTRDTVHQLEIRVQTAQSQFSSLQQMQTRLQTQAETLKERKATIYKEIRSDSILESLKNDLDNALKGRLLLQAELSSARQASETVAQELHELEIKRQEVEREIARLRDMLEALRVEWQGIKVKAETLVEQIAETGLNLEDILKQLPETATPHEWHARLEQVAQRIARLGPINLIAIEEYTVCDERKQYLDKQYHDLQEALNTLGSAIEKIDKETRLRFKQTFDKVNARFQELFPLVFGGGQAYLELTGENLLDAGITVMACPPGKRNSTIHLLSGGEKAMTAIALVFSIFHLNPAPFCLLDEVDAPLDDANIGRFCQLVKNMSDKTQFIFISHNKLAIEMAETLIGVTMNEPGVSRLVTVDVQQAMTLAGV